jgi:hypothetical protein
MEKDVRRGRDQWRGCWAFKDIICDGDGARSPKRNGGLKMGHSYWYYVCERPDPFPQRNICTDCIPV